VNIDRSKNIIVAIPKGRILKELIPLLKKDDIELDEEFFNEKSRKLFFDTNIPFLKAIICRSFDAATFVSYGAADFGFCGSDVIEEFDYRNIYKMLDLDIGKCRFSIAGKAKKDIEAKKDVVVATKYPNLTKGFFAKKGIKAEVIKLNGSIEVAAKLDLCDFIADLVSTGTTLKENNLKELEKVTKVSSQLIVNKSSLVTNNDLMLKVLERFIDV